MLAILKRYFIALIFFILVICLMLLGTLGVKMFGDKMLENTDAPMKPRGEKIIL
jgi:uncharacterized membrane protein